MNDDDVARSIRNFKGQGLFETIGELFTGFRRPFENLQVEVTTSCPGSCLYCPGTVFSDRWVNRHMDWDTYTKLWPVLRKSNRVHLQGWGEPFLNPYFFHMVKLALKAGAQVSTTTCGTLINERLAEEIVKSGIDIIAFSLTGTDKESSHMRRGVNFDKVCDSIRLLQRERKKRGGVHLEIHIAYLLLWGDRYAVLKLPELMNELGVHGAVISTLDYIASAELEEEAVKKSDVKMAEALEILETASNKARKYGVRFHSNLSDSLKEVKGCSENIKKNFVVSAEGIVSPCVLANINGLNGANRRVFGSVLKEDILQIWEKEGFISFREKLYGGEPDEICRKCLKNYCY